LQWHAGTEKVLFLLIKSSKNYALETLLLSMKKIAEKGYADEAQCIAI
jgi:hypothetical protein